MFALACVQCTRVPTWFYAFLLIWFAVTVFELVRRGLSWAARRWL